MYPKKTKRIFVIHDGIPFRMSRNVPVIFVRNEMSSRTVTIAVPVRIFNILGSRKPGIAQKALIWSFDHIS